MDDDDFDLAFELYDRVKPKVVASNVGFTSRFYQTPNPTLNPVNTSSSSVSMTRNSHIASAPTNTSVSGHTFRSSFAAPAAPKSASISPLNIHQSSNTASSSSNRHFLLPEKSTHTRSPKNPIIHVSTPSTPVSPSRRDFNTSKIPGNTDMTSWDDDDDVLAPVPGISKELKLKPSPKKSAGRSPAPSKRAASYATTLAKRSSADENNHTLSMGAEEEISVLPVDAASIAFPPECDRTAARHWEYPSNYEKRDYQFAMVESALFQNSLICLPTGLGKTLIAAVVMYNFYRWFPNGKIIFMAPTKPLVEQQIEACRDIVSIPPSHSIAMTGKMSSDTRAKHWTSKRIFFVTPQIPQNDIASGICPVEQICLLVFDEAHKAHGDYAYCDVIRGVAKATPYFRVLALSATPGSDFASAQDVFSNLLISKIELRTEESPDVKPFVHSRFIEEVHVQIEGPILKVREMLKALIGAPITWLQANNALYRTKKGEHFTFTRLEAARADFRSNPDLQRKDEFWKSQVESRYAVAMSLLQGYKRISDYGLGSFKAWFNTQTNRRVLEKTSKYFDEIVTSKAWCALSHFVNEEIGDATQCRHPKMSKLEGVVLEHFQEVQRTSESDGSETRVIIFVQFRESVEEIVAMLKEHEPTIRPMAFVGQAKKGLSQKQQAEVVKRFREGHYNTLVSTSIGEEGLDIGEVDLIVCYDTQQSPIRMVQRMGRTGRKRNGRCVMLLTVGTEDVSFKRATVKSKQMIKTISSSMRFNFFKGAESRHILPSDLPTPQPLMCRMEPIVELEPTPAAPKKRAKRSSAKKASASLSRDSEPLDLPYQDVLPIESEALSSENQLTSEADFEREMVDSDLACPSSSDSEIPLDENDLMDQPLPNPMFYNAGEQVSMSELTSVVPRAMSHSTQAKIASISPYEHIQLTTNKPTVAKPASIFDLAVPPLRASSSVLTKSASRSQIMDESGDSLDVLGPHLKPLNDFPAGFFDISSQSPAIFIPPPPDVPLPIDFELGLIPMPPSQLLSPNDVSRVPPVLQLPISGLKPSEIDPNSATNDAHGAVRVNENEGSKMIFHSLPDLVSPQRRIDQPSQSTDVVTATSPSQSKKVISAPAKSPPKSQTLPPTNNSSYLSVSIGSSAPSSPKLKRLKRGREVIDEDLITIDDSVASSSSPPPAKRACTPAANRLRRNNSRPSRFIAEEASLDEDDEELIGSDEERLQPGDEMPNSQDLAFIAEEGECDTSLTGMRAVYAKSLGSPDSHRGGSRSMARGLKGLNWLNGKDLDEKFKEWAEYSDMEDVSFSQSTGGFNEGLNASVHADMNISIESEDIEASDTPSGVQSKNLPTSRPTASFAPTSAFQSRSTLATANLGNEPGLALNSVTTDRTKPILPTKYPEVVTIDEDEETMDVPLSSTMTSTRQPPSTNHQQTQFATLQSPPSSFRSVNSPALSSRALSLSIASAAPSQSQGVRLGFQKHSISVPAHSKPPIAVQSSSNDFSLSSSQSKGGSATTKTSHPTSRIPLPASQTRTRVVIDELLDGLDMDDFMDVGEFGNR